MIVMTRTAFALVAALALSLSSAARAQETFDSLAGTWWFKLGGKDSGAMLIAFTAPHEGVFEVADTIAEQPSFGFSNALGAFFFVASGQQLSFDSKANVVGTVELTDESDAVIGTLTFEKGKPNKKFTKWSVRASIAGEDLPVVAKLSGKRIPETFPVLSGGNPSSRLSGKGVKSKAFDLHVASDTVLGLPAYEFGGAGPVSIDKVETPDVTLAGRFILSPKFELFGLLEDSSDFGTGPVKGKLKLPKNSLAPKLNLVARADRKVTAKSKLVEAVDPVLSVTPTSFDFGALHLDETKDQAFAVTNAGAGVLSGEVTFLSGDADDFEIASAADYGPLDPDSPAENIFIRFAPTAAGNKSAQFLFDVNGGRVGAKVVTVTGVGGIAELTVDPTSIDFLDTAVNNSVFQTVMISNTGDGILTGQATTTGSAFAIVPLGTQNPVAVLPYTLDPGQSRSFSVRFLPTTTGEQTGALILTGGGGAQVPLTGATP